MSEFLVNLIDINENIDYSTVLAMFCSYLLVLWFVISLWVGVDSWRRYGSKKLAIMLGFLTFFLNFPMVIFYFIIRPEDKLESYEDWDMGGVNVPVVNFVGKEGVEMALELKIHPSKLSPEQTGDMKIDVSWDSADEKMKLSAKPEVIKSELRDSKSKTLPKRARKSISTTFSSVGGFVSKQMKAIKEVSVSYANNTKEKAHKRRKNAALKKASGKSKVKVGKRLQGASKNLKNRLKKTKQTSKKIASKSKNKSKKKKGKKQ